MDELIDFLVELQLRQQDLTDHPCYIHKFYYSSGDGDAPYIVMVVQEGTPAAREMTREFTRILGKKVKVSRHPYESYLRGLGTHDYIVSLVKEKVK